MLQGQFKTKEGWSNLETILSITPVGVLKKAETLNEFSTSARMTTVIEYHIIYINTFKKELVSVVVDSLSDIKL